MAVWTGKDRRHTTDIWVVVAKTLAVTSWALFLFALIMSYYAAPEVDYGYLRFKEIEIRKFWNTPLTGYLYIVLWVSAFLSYLYLIIDKYRNRRRSDNGAFNVTLLLVICMVWVVYIIVNLSS